MIKIISPSNDRIDKVITVNSELSRNDVKSLIEQGAVFVNGMQIRKGSFIVKLDAEIEVTKVLDKITHVNAEPMDLDIVFEDDYLMVINKPSGLVVHPAPGHASGTLVNGLFNHVKQLSNINGLLRPGIVHRIDKDTSGLLVVAKTNEAHQKLSKLLSDHKIKREYLAIVEGFLPNRITHINLPIGRDFHDRKRMAITHNNSKDANTDVYLLGQFSVSSQPYSYIKCLLKTGRTHQIRVHLAYLKAPVLNDPVYGKISQNRKFGQYLHAYKLNFVHPFTNQEMHFEAPLPNEFSDFLKSAENYKNFEN